MTSQASGGLSAPPRCLFADNVITPTFLLYLFPAGEGPNSIRTDKPRPATEQLECRRGVHDSLLMALTIRIRISEQAETSDCELTII